MTAIPLRIMLACFLLAPSVAGAGDVASLPPDPARVHASLTADPVALGRAIEVAQREAGGVVYALEWRQEESTFQVKVARADGVNRILEIDAATGHVISQEERGRFPGEIVTGEGILSPSGLLHFELEAGKGAHPASATAKVEVHYSGWLLDGTRFDSTHERGQPLIFGLDQVIEGWTEGLQSLRAGGRRKLIVPASLGYGDAGVPGLIPAGATLVFDVELISLP